MNQATGYASQHISCLSHARINWEGCAWRGIRHKMVGMAEVASPISLDGWQSVRIVGASACVIFILHDKIQKMLNKDIIFGRHHIPTQTGGGETQPERSTTLIG